MGWTLGGWGGVGPLPVCSTDGAALWELGRHWPGGEGGEVCPDLTVDCQKLWEVFRASSSSSVKWECPASHPCIVTPDKKVRYHSQLRASYGLHGGPWGIEVILNDHNLTRQENHSMLPCSFSKDAWVIFTELKTRNRYNISFNFFPLSSLASPKLVHFQGWYILSEIVFQIEAPFYCSFKSLTVFLFFKWH